jgi:Encapsulating protein for peroxidase
VLTTRGGDVGLHIGHEVSIGYSSHTDAVVCLYLQETFTFLLLTTEAAIELAPTGNARSNSARDGEGRKRLPIEATLNVCLWR